MKSGNVIRLGSSRPIRYHVIAESDSEGNYRTLCGRNGCADVFPFWNANQHSHESRNYTSQQDGGETPPLPMCAKCLKAEGN